jgi:hypothetical protein
VVGWLKNNQSHSENVAELNGLAQRYAQPGATSRAADYLLGVLCDGRSTEGGRDDEESPPTEQAAEVAA